jgi:hypothetical protein
MGHAVRIEGETIMTAPSGERATHEIGGSVRLACAATAPGTLRKRSAAPTSVPGPTTTLRNCQMSHTEKRHSLCGAHQARLAVVLERQADVALAQQLRISRQTIARAVAGMRLNSTSRAVLESYLGSIAA